MLQKHEQPYFIIGCSSKKLSEASPAKNLYLSKRFELAKQIATQFGNNWSILSAKHGLLSPNKTTKPYDLSINDLNTNQRKEWVKSVEKQLHLLLKNHQKIVYIGDLDYFREIEQSLLLSGYKVYNIFKYVKYQYRIPWLKEKLKNCSKHTDLKKLYSLLKECRKAGLIRNVGSETCSQDTPPKGLYIFFDDKEYRLVEDDTPRICRIGTHGVSKGSKSSLWQRIKNHKGNVDKSGNHRGSIFRLHVGSALINRDNLDFPSWAKDQTTNNNFKRDERDLEIQVSDYISTLSILCIDIRDKSSKDSDRAYLERNLISLLTSKSNPLDYPSDDWLGYWCENEKVREIALWNVAHTNDKYDPAFLKIFEEYISLTISGKEPPSKSKAPNGWNTKTGKDHNQLELF